MRPASHINICSRILHTCTHDKGHTRFNLMMNITDIFTQVRWFDSKLYRIYHIYKLKVLSMTTEVKMSLEVWAKNIQIRISLRPLLGTHIHQSRWLYIMMTSSNIIIFCVTDSLWGESTGPGGFPSQRPETRSCDVFFDLRLNKRLSSSRRWFETPSRPLWRHCNVELYRRTNWHGWLPKTVVR